MVKKKKNINNEGKINVCGLKEATVFLVRKYCLWKETIFSG
jgi:hypothetical protein